MDYKAPPGVFDILPKDPKEKWRCTYLWNYVEETIRGIAEEYGYQEIRTPLFEKTELFKRGVGESSDIVSKEMYTFVDKGSRSLTLRPEGTASVARAYIEHRLDTEAPLQKLYYIGPMFRYERAQAGRYRQHHQFGAEAIGNPSPEQDAEMIDLLYSLYQRLGLKNLRVMLNCIGDAECRQRYRTALIEYLKGFQSQLSEDSQKRLEKNPLRILDSKDPADCAIMEKAPSILEFLSEECKQHFAQLLCLLNALEIPYEINPKIVRGLDYYNRTVYEIVAQELGSQNSIGGGGRYDTLIKTLGGPDAPATGFATGIERIIQTMIGQNVALPEPYRPTIFLIAMGEEAKLSCFRILRELRQHNIRAQMDFSQRKLQKIFGYADQIRAKFVAVVGDNELKSGLIELKNMETGEKRHAPLYRLPKILKMEAEGEDFIRIWKEMNTPFEDPLEAEFFLEKIKHSIDHTKELTLELQAAMKKIEQMRK